MSIDQIIEKAKEYYSYFNTSDKSKETYARFLGEDARKTAKADIIYLADKIILYSILTRQTPTLTQNGLEKIDEPQKLKQLQITTGTNNWTDGQLFSLFGRRQTQTRMNYPTYSELLTQIGQHEDIIKIWGFQIEYDIHIRKKALIRNRK